VPNLVVPGHVVSELRGVRFSGFPFEWDMACNNLPCNTVQAVINCCTFGELTYTAYTTLSVYCRMRSEMTNWFTMSQFKVVISELYVQCNYVDPLRVKHCDIQSNSKDNFNVLL
jgi:hypothetical protein